MNIISKVSTPIMYLMLKVVQFITVQELFHIQSMEIVIKNGYLD